jgi:hypothetical protein
VRAQVGYSDARITLAASSHTVEKPPLAVEQFARILMPMPSQRSRLSGFNRVVGVSDRI